MLPPTPRARWLLAALLALPLRGEDAPKPAAIGVSVQNVFDNRNTAMGGGCQVFLSLTGDAVADAYSIRSIRVTKAEDMLGRDLVKTNATYLAPVEGGTPSPADEQRRLDAVAAEVARRRELRERGASSMASPVSVSAVPRVVSAVAPRPSRMPAQPAVALRNPSRQSAAIKVIEGEIELFTPTAANGGIVRIPNLPAAPGTFLDHEALKKAGVRVMYLTPESYAAKREEPSANRDDASGPWTDEVADQIKLLSRSSKNAPLPLAIFFIDDPNHVLVNLEVQAKDGRGLERSMTSTGYARLRTAYVDGALPADAQLAVHLAIPEAVKSYPFKLENIPLP